MTPSPDTKGQPEQLVEEARCPDCGIPEIWCRRVSSDRSHCWRWDYERFDEVATALSECREALKAADDYIDLALTISLEDPDPVLFFHVKDRYLRSLVTRRSALAGSSTEGVTQPEQLVEQMRELVAAAPRLGQSVFAEDAKKLLADAATALSECRERAEADWTKGESGRSNSSKRFLQLRTEVARLIRDDAHKLLAGNAEATAVLILAQLAHVHGLAPIAAQPPSKDNERNGT